MRSYHFGPFRLVPSGRSLMEGEARVPLGGRAFDILVALVERAGEVVSKEDLLEQVWGNAAIDGTNLRVHIAALRKALKARDDSYVSSVPGQGYCFVAAVTKVEEGTSGSAAPRALASSPPPSLLTRVIGREDVLVGLKQQVLSKRFVTIVGPAGIGKSTVAVSLAGMLAPEFRDGCHFVDLLSVGDPQAVPNALALAIDATLSGDDPGATLVQALRHKQALLVLDNCEHLIDAVAMLSERLLQAAPGLALIATTREPLRAQGEWVSRLPPLEYPDSDGDLTANQALEFAAVELFVERASAVSDEFSFSDAAAPLVAELCARLDGIPLAIELAAARADAFSIRELAARFDDRFRLLMKGRRTALARHQTLRGALDWSYQLLSASQQSLLRSLGVFPASFVIDDAVAVAAGRLSVDEDVAEVLSELVFKSLVILDVRSEHARFRLLATTRAYALEKLTEAGELLPLRRLYAERVRVRIDDILESAKQRGSAPLAKNYPGVIDDLRAALVWAYSPDGDTHFAASLTASAAPLFSSFSVHAEFGPYVDRALETARSLGDPRLEMRLSYAAAGLSLHTHQDVAEDLFARALALATSLGDRVFQAYAAEATWASNFGRAEYPRCVLLAKDYASIPEATELHGAQSARLLGISLHFSGQLRAAREQLEDAFNRFSMSGGWRPEHPVQTSPQVSSAISLARNFWLRGDYGRAVALTDDMLERALASGHLLSICYVLGFAACPIALWRGDRIEATRLVGLLTKASVRSGLGLWQSWARCYEAVLSAQARVPSPLNDMQREVLCTVREEWADSGLLSRFERGLAGWCGAEVLRVQAESVLRAGGPEARSAAEATLNRALSLARSQGAAFWELRCSTSLARLWRDTGRGAAARALLEPWASSGTDEVSSLDFESARSLLSELS